MRVKRFEALMKQLLEERDHPEIVEVETFEEAGYTSKPVGLRIRFASGAAVFVQFVRTSPPRGDNFSEEEYVIAKDAL